MANIRHPERADTHASVNERGVRMYKGKRVVRIREQQGEPRKGLVHRVWGFSLSGYSRGIECGFSFRRSSVSV